MKLKFLFLFIFTFLLSQISFAQETINTSGGQRGYQVGPGDVVMINVLGEKDFNVDEATVDEDGKIQVPFFEQGVLAKCRTEKELTADIRKLLLTYLRSPQVTVRVKQRNSRPPATIYGEVRNPQQIILTRRATLLELLSFSGGVTEDAGGMIQVFRTQPLMCGESSADNVWKVDSSDKLDFPSRMYSLSSVKKGEEESNPVIYPGDVVVVQRAAPVYITGEVMSPQGIYLKDGSLSLTEAIAKIGGVRREAKTKDIKIYRLKANSKDREIISVNYDSIKKGKQKDIMLEPYDIVEVDKSKKSIAQIIFETVTGTAKGLVSSLGGVLPQRILY